MDIKMNKFSHIPTDEAINALIANKQVIAATGAYFGDEAKGKTVDSIARHPGITTIARVNSGDNAGHTVIYNDKKHVFHLLPSAVFTGKKVLIHNNAVMNPLTFYHKEISQVLDSDFPTDNIFIGNTSLVFPWHIIADCLRDPNASTGKGMSQIHSDMRAKCDVSLESLINGNYDSFRPSLEKWWNHISPRLSNENVEKLIRNNKQYLDLEQFIGSLSPQGRLAMLEELYEGEVLDFLTSHYADTSQIMIEELEKGNRILLEGPQSFYLSNSVDTHHNSSTSADTHATGIYGASNLPPKYTNHALTINIHKAPGSSRVGKGANPSGHVHQDWFNERGLTKDDLPMDIDVNFSLKQFVRSIDKDGFQDSNTLYIDQDGNDKMFSGEYLTVNEALAIAEVVEYEEFGSTTGKPRITGALDIPHLKNLKKFQQGRLSISCLDRGDGLEHALLVVGYQYNGDEYNYLGTVFKPGDVISSHPSLDLGKEPVTYNLPGEEVLKHCRPIYEVHPGWERASSLERNVQSYMSRIEELSGMNIVSIGVGPKTDQIMYLKRI